MSFVSVIIPVYNAGRYVPDAVESALIQPQTGEVILIEDNSLDNSLEICHQLIATHEKVILLRHPNGENRGAGASRNLGIQQANFPYVAFLDADDIYLPNRFDIDIEIMEANKQVDGVYNASIGWLDESSESLQERMDLQKHTGKLVTLSKQIPPEDLFMALLSRNYGAFNTLSITVRRSLFEKTGLFDEHLRLSQDVALWLKMAAVGRLMPGNIQEPVSMYRVHGANRSRGLDRNVQFRALREMYITVWFWCRVNTDKEKEIKVFWKLIRVLRNYYKNESGTQLQSHLILKELMLCIIRQPTIAIESYFLKDFLLQIPFVRMFKNNEDDKD